ncbi:class I SAM-dependent methyltransferase [Halorubrum sp. BV1]|uniref:class I SAM-dependent methyltransferase n=1 Tax=Halorubrum sp. BV1 TaxID=1498500 RepID=UPI000679A228|nr:class I SAM-dependent methyltransferase [Halorubrum sp. BV1]
MNLFAQAVRVYKEEGLFPLMRKIWNHGVIRLSRALVVNPVEYSLTKRAVRKRMASENGLQQILDTVLDVEPGYGDYVLHALQLREELAELTRVVDEYDPETIMEIGTANGGAFYVWCRHLDTASKFISIDLPGGLFTDDERKIGLFQSFSPGKELRFIRADSHDQSTYDRVRDDILDDQESIDFLFIDGDHSYEGVKQDFQMYADLMADDGIVAFHDIVTHPDDPEAVEERRDSTEVEDRHLKWTDTHPGCEVDQFWAELKGEYSTEEFISHPNQTWGGIGVVYL